MIENIVLNMARSAVLDNIEALDKKTLQRELRKTLEEKFILQDRVAKAIDYINETLKICRANTLNEGYLNVDKLLEILRGDKE